MDLSVNGSEVARKQAKGDIASSNYPVKIGRNSEEVGRVSGLPIHTAKIYARALSGDEVANCLSIDRRRDLCWRWISQRPLGGPS